MSLLTDLKMWTKFEVTLEFCTPCIGGCPNAKNLIEGWLKTKNLVATEAELKLLVEATAAEVGGVVEEKASAMWTVFKQDKTGIYLEGRQVKAMFKESANILREMLVKAEGKGKVAKGAERSRFTNLKSRIAERLFVVEDQIYFARNSPGGSLDSSTAFLTGPDGSEERPIHVQTPMGPRTALKRTDYVRAGTQITFTVKTLNDGVADKELLAVLLEHSSDNGLGADRSQGFGKFKVVGVKDL